MNEDINKLILFCSILDYGKGSKALKLSKKVGGVEGTIFLGKGTVRNELLNILGFSEVRKEIFLTIINKELEDLFYDEMFTKFNLDKPHHGIAFSMELKNLLRRDNGRSLASQKKGVDNMDYEAIFTIVDKGLSDNVLEAAEIAGSRGGTIIHGRGSGTTEKEKLFNIEIEPEKDIILILAKIEESEKIVNSIKEMLDITKPGAGIIFTLDVNRTLGLYGD